ncbi:hypothetical protein IU450_34110 [Nocardia abscessus]|uniref:8-oxoguanine DNA glycosylase OGG fold protein n=1 Tax=Nocardia abscessus TaxID=120957 RepID=UPI001892F629|nr:hypothetical protein [Nocardia abscessus]MBF6340888.1 hypothetical protein [Nocardia abscessus]
MTADVLLDAPAGLKQWLSGADAQEVIFAHRIEIVPQWWAHNLAAYGFDNPVVDTSVSRGQLFAMADAAVVSGEGALALLWNSLAWGVGRRARNNRQRIASMAAGRDNHAALLVEAARASRSDPVAAYALLRPSPYRNAVRWLGPAFFTKFLYFAGGGRADHPCCIIDNRVAAALRAAGWAGLAGSGWSPDVYGRYLRLLHRWQNECDCTRPDLIERWLFDTGSLAT